MSSKKTVIIIPARLGSTRLPKKPLINIDGLPMVIRVYQQALKANLGDVVIAGCDEELENLVKLYGYNYIATDSKLQSGTDRVFQGYDALDQEYDYIINLQGDMPYISPQTIIAVNDLLNDESNCDVDIATAVTVISEKNSIDDPNVVKAIVSYQNMALYFTRSPIKFDKNYKHVGIYGFNPKSLKALFQWLHLIWKNKKV